MRRFGKVMTGLAFGCSVLSMWVSQHRRILGLTLAAFAISFAVESVRFALFGTRISWEVTLVFAPVYEDCLKLGLVFYFLGMATLVTGALGSARRPETFRATRVTLVLYPMIAGGVLALFEPASLNRALGHTASVGLGFGVCLVAWRRRNPFTGFLFGLTVAALVHSFLNTAYYWPLVPTGGYQLMAALGLLVVAIWILSRTARKEPASEFAREFFPWRIESQPPRLRPDT